MHFFVWLLIILLGVLVAGLASGFLYLQSTQSNQALLNAISFTKVDSSFGNGEVNGTLWTTAPPQQQAILAKVQDLRTFLALADWFVSVALPDPTLPLYFALPEVAFSVKTFIAAQSGFVYPAGTDNLKGFLLSPTKLAFHFAQGEVATTHVLTGNDLTIPGAGELAVILIYTAAP